MTSNHQETEKLLRLIVTWMKLGSAKNLADTAKDAENHLDRMDIARESKEATEKHPLSGLDPDRIKQWQANIMGNESADKIKGIHPITY